MKRYRDLRERLSSVNLRRKLARLVLLLRRLRKLKKRRLLVLPLN